MFTGGPLGNVIAFPVAGWISASKIGWPLVFYLYGGIGVVWSIIWFIVGSDSPAKHNTISAAEREYIESGIEGDEDKEVNIVVIILYLNLTKHINLNIYFLPCFHTRISSSKGFLLL